MASGTPQVLRRVAGRSMTRHVRATLEALAPQHIVVEAASGERGAPWGLDADDVAEAAAPHRVVVVQAEEGGIGDAVQIAHGARSLRRPIVVLCGDVPAAARRRPSATSLGRGGPRLARPCRRSPFWASGPPSGSRLPMQDAAGRLRARGRRRGWCPRAQPRPPKLGRPLQRGRAGSTNAVRAARGAEDPRPINAGEQGSVDAAEGAQGALPGRRRGARARRRRPALCPRGGRGGGLARERPGGGGASAPPRRPPAPRRDPATVYLSVDTQLGRDVTIGPAWAGQRDHPGVAALAGGAAGFPECRLGPGRRRAVGWPPARGRPAGALARAATPGRAAVVATKRARIARPGPPRREPGSVPGSGARPVRTRGRRGCPPLFFDGLATPARRLAGEQVLAVREIDVSHRRATPRRLAAHRAGTRLNSPFGTGRQSWRIAAPVPPVPAGFVIGSGRDVENPWKTGKSAARIV